jgi:hypothetical protein
MEEPKSSITAGVDTLIRAVIVAVVAVVAWMLPTPWYFSAAFFLASLFMLGIFYPAIQVNRPFKSRRV